ncbi:MarR family transcriptional regulator [Streptomyces sp. SPB162]|uniref:MarR family winged helix-turn-helix transcriptional regulator n=1 Tax=Streptomyces sp. SPB162 TaxID=2940560 RepID=UPI002404E7BF|nr:MarR family transcriptional regulator [Streptomyces sp. SPB162]
MDDRATPDRLRKLPSRLLVRTASHADRLVSEALATESARKWHFVVLVALTEAGPASQSALSTRTGIFRSDMVAVINDLADRGLVERAPDPDDRRRNVITVTARGRAYLRRLDDIIDTAQEDLLAPLNEAERGQLTSLLTRLLDHHAKAAPHGGR